MKTIYDFSVKDADLKDVSLENYKEKILLIVNVASYCGLTYQYEGIESLYKKYKDKGFEVLAFPCNQFAFQEPGTNEEIKNFCETNFNITFPITDKVDVKGDNLHEIYNWAKNNYGKSTIPKWNFHKILINKNGKIQKTFNSFIDPLSSKITKEIETIL